MPSPVVNPALGTKLYHGVAGTPITYTAISQVVSIDGPESEMGTRETHNLDSTAKTYATTLFDGGEVSLDIQYDPKCTTHAILQGLFFGKTQLADGELWKIVFADVVNGPSTAAFKAIIINLGPNKMEPENNLMASMKIKISGDVSWP
jgi:hypothetical protein